MKEPMGSWLKHSIDIGKEKFQWVGGGMSVSIKDRLSKIEKKNIRGPCQYIEADTKSMRNLDLLISS